MSNGFALMIEGAVAVLLVTTIGYCFILNRKLVRLRTDETALRATIAELVTATDIAERAIAGFKTAIRDCDVTLAERLRTAERVSVDMADKIGAGQEVLKRIALITEAARSASVAITADADADADADVDAAEDMDERVEPAAEVAFVPQSKAAAAALAAQALAMRARERRAASAAA